MVNIHIPEAVFDFQRPAEKLEEDLGKASADMNEPSDKEAHFHNQEV